VKLASPATLLFSPDNVSAARIPRSSYAQAAGDPSVGDLPGIFASIASRITV